jgi:hypothetical protein
VTGGTGQVRPVSYESGDRAERYNVVQLGNAETRQGLVDVDLSGDEGPARSGLLKSVDADGAWTGTVYLTPFHAGVDVTPVAERDALTVTADGTAVALSDAVEDETGWIFQHNDQIEITFEAAVDDGTADLEVAAYADGARTPFDAVTFDVGESTRRFRYVVHNQLPLSDVEIRLRAGADDAEPSVTDLSVVAQRRETARKYFGDPLGTPHRGGVRFDVLRDPVPADGGGAR